MSTEWTKYRKRGLAEMRPYEPGEEMHDVSISISDTPAQGGMIARNPENHLDQWYVAERFFLENYEMVDEGDQSRFMEWLNNQ